MTREDIIQMAREAGCGWAHNGTQPSLVGEEMLERFAALVAEAERERMTVNSIHSCGPDCQKPLCVNRRREIAEAVEAEREACKQIAKEQAAQYKVGGALQMVMEKYSAQAAASACGHIAHLIEQRGGANDR
jgi:hypothetical protein